MVTSYSSTNVTLVATMTMVLMILSMCGTFGNVAATLIDSIFQLKRTRVTVNNQLAKRSHIS
jgi:hypothetical protein